MEEEERKAPRFKNITLSYPSRGRGKNTRSAGSLSKRFNLYRHLTILYISNYVYIFPTRLFHTVHRAKGSFFPRQRLNHQHNSFTLTHCIIERVLNLSAACMRGHKLRASKRCKVNLLDADRPEALYP